MADRIITAEAVISAKDQTGAAFDSIAKKISGFAKNLPGSEKLEGLTKSLQKVDSAMRAVDKLQGARDRALNARNNYSQMAAGVEAARKAMAAADGPSKKLAANFDAATRAAAKAEDTMRRQAAAVLLAKKAVEQYGVPTNNLLASQERLRALADNATRAIERQARAERQAAQMHTVYEKAQHRRAEGIAHHGFRNYVVGGAAAYVGAHGVMSAIEHTAKAGARYQHEIVALQNSGRTPEEIREIEAHSRAVSMRVPTASYEENLRTVGETVGAFGNLHHALENLEFMAKASSVLKSAAGDKISGGAAELGNKMARFFEERQVAGDTPTFQREAEGLIRAMAFSRGTFNPESALAFAQQAKSALPNYSERFLTKIMPSMATMLGGDRAGTAANAFNSVITGKVNDKKQAEEWLRYGLLDKKMAVIQKGHAVGWRAGAIKNTPLALSDPLRWIEEVMLPAMKAKGVNVDDRLALTTALATMFRNQNSNVWANDLAQAASRARLHKDEANINQAGRLNQIYARNLGSDPSAAFSALTASLESLMSAASSPLMAPAAAGMTGLARTLQSVSDVAQRNPFVATTLAAGAAGGALYGAGRLSYSLMNGFGLTGSAAALDRAAAHLMMVGGPAGGRFGAYAPAIVGGAGSGIPATAAGLLGGGALSLATGLGTLAVIGGMAGLVKASMATQQPGMGGAWSAPTNATLPEDQARLADLRQQHADLGDRLRRRRASNRFGGFDIEEQRLADQQADTANQIRELENGLRALPGNPQNMPTFTHPTFAGGGRFNKKGRLSFAGSYPNFPMQGVGPASPDMPLFGISGGGLGSRLPGPMPGSSPIELKLPEQHVHVDTQVTAKFQLLAPAGFSMTQLGATTSISRVSGPDTGVSMPGAAGVPGAGEKP